MRLVLAGALLLAGCGLTQQSPFGPGQRLPLRADGVSTERAPCAPRRELLDLLAAGTAQTPVARGLAKAGGLVARTSIVEVLATEDGTIWTALLTAPNGVSCVLAGGEAWQSLLEPGVTFAP